jgi:biopolymer transport protein ExbB
MFMNNLIKFFKVSAVLMAFWVTLSVTQVGWAVQENMDDILGGQAGQAAPVNPAANPANPPVNPAQGDPKPDTGSSNMLVWLFQALGPLYTVVFLALSIALVTLLVMNIIAVRRDNICPPDLVEGVEQHFAEGNPQAAAELLRTDDSFLGQVVSAGLNKLDKGHPAAIEAMQEVGEEEVMKMEHSLGYIGLIGNISPMVGLLGTVDGMVAAFRTIAMSGSTPNAGTLAMNISLALVTTLAGLIIAIPAIAICNILKNRVQRLTLQVGIISEDLLERFLKK